MLKGSTNNKTKRRQLLSLKRPHNITSKGIDSDSTGVSSSPSCTPRTSSSSKTDDSSNDIPLSDTLTADSLGEYNCPICNKELSNFQTSFSRQRHIDACLTNPALEASEDDTLDSIFFNYCSFCGKSIGHMTGIYKERHFDQCLTDLEAEQHQADEEQRLSTYAGHSIPFLKELDLCPCCHELFPGGGLRGKVRHMKRCAKQRSITMEQLLRKFQWMQWGHLPVAKPQLDVSRTTTTTTTTPVPPILYSVHATDSTSPSHSRNHSTSVDLVADTIKNNDDDFNNNAVIYKVASWHQTKIKKPKPTEDESIAIALSLSLHEEQHGDDRAPKSKRGKRKLDWNVSNILSIEESKQSARLALHRMLEKDALTMGDLKKTQFPLVTSRVQPIIPNRRSHKTTLCLPLWSQASCLD